MPFRSLWPNARQMFALFGRPPPRHIVGVMFLPVPCARHALQIFNPVVGGVPVDVVYLPACGDSAVVVYPYIPVQSGAGARKVAPMRRIR